MLVGVLALFPVQSLALVLALFPVQSLAVVLALFPVQSLALVNVSATLPMGRLSQYFTGLCFVGPFVRLLICCSLIERQS